MSSREHSRHPLSILVVDDLRDVAESEADLLVLWGHAVRVALNGAEALRCVEAERPDVVLLDIRMPGADGFSVAQAIRQRCTGGKQPLVVAITGCGSEADRDQCADAGFDLHLVKPVDPAVLVDVLERFRQLLSPPIPSAEVEPSPEEPPDRRFRVRAEVY